MPFSSEIKKMVYKNSKMYAKSFYFSRFGIHEEAGDRSLPLNCFHLGFSFLLGL